MRLKVRYMYDRDESVKQVMLKCLHANENHDEINHCLCIMLKKRLISVGQNYINNLLSGHGVKEVLALAFIDLPNELEIALSDRRVLDAANIQIEDKILEAPDCAGLVIDLGQYFQNDVFCRFIYAASYPQI